MGACAGQKPAGNSQPLDRKQVTNEQNPEAQKAKQVKESSPPTNENTNNELAGNKKE